MKAMAEYAMRGRLHAASLASLFAVLSLVLPPLSYISGALVALVTMRRGNSEGAVIAVISAIVLSVVAQFATGNMVIGFVFALMVWLPVWILSVVLRKTVSLMLTVSAAALISAIAVIGFHAMVGDTVTWWLSIIDQLFVEAFEQSGADATQLKMMRENMSQFMTGLMATAFFLSMVLSIFLGRWWQAVLYNPGGFKTEFHAFRLDKTVAIIGALILVWASVLAEAGSVAIDLAFVVSVFGSVAGLALVHHFVDTRGVNKAWVITLYLLLMFVAPQLLVLLAIAGFADAWMDLRRFYKSKTI